jgi:hypothetical protein
MVERICRGCNYGNSVDSQYCNKCGAALERIVRVPAEPSTALAKRGAALPVRWQQIGKTVAIGAFALAAEAGLTWLKKRIETPPEAPLARKEPQSPIQKQSHQHTTTVISHRVVEITQEGDGSRRVEDRHVWRKIEE